MSLLWIVDDERFAESSGAVQATADPIGKLAVNENVNSRKAIGSFHCLIGKEHAAIRLGCCDILFHFTGFVANRFVEADRFACLKLELPMVQ